MKEETRETGKCMAGTIMATEVEKRIFEHKCYEAYRLYWMLSHGNTLQELSGAINSLAAELVETDPVSAATDGDSTRRLMENAEQSFLCDSGFCGAVWANKEKFLSEEFCDPDYMKTLLSLRSDGDEMWKFYQAHYMPDSSEGKKPYTNQELFHVLCEQVEMPEHLQSAMPADDIRSIKRADGLFWNRLEFGNSGNIHLEIGLEYFNPEHEIIDLGCFLTQDTSLQAIEDMGKLLADLVYVMNDLVKNNREDFEWEGYRICGIKEDGQPSYASRYHQIGLTMYEVGKLLKSYPYVQLFDYSEHTESYYCTGKDNALVKCKTLEECKQKRVS